MLTLHLESAHVSSIVTSRYRPRSALSSIRLRNSTWEQSNSHVWLSLAMYIRNETSSRILLLYTNASCSHLCRQKFFQMILRIKMNIFLSLFFSQFSVIRIFSSIQFRF